MIIGQSFGSRRSIRVGGFIWFLDHLQTADKIQSKQRPKHSKVFVKPHFIMIISLSVLAWKSGCDISLLYLVVMNWVFPLRFHFYRIEYFYGFENTWYISCNWILVVTMGVSYWFTWYMFWHSTRGFSRWHWGNLCIDVDARSCLCFSGRNLGALLEVLCVGLSIMNLKLFGVILVWTLG